MHCIEQQFVIAPCLVLFIPHLLLFITDLYRSEPNTLLVLGEL